MTKKDKFIQHVKEEAKKFGITCKLRNVKYFKSGKITFSGYFDEVEKVLAVAMNDESALEILVHEYCHMTQWADKIEIWNKASRSILKVDEWLSGKSERNIDEAFEYTKLLELDNEKRSVKIIKKFNLPINIELYIKKANAYIQFYNWIRITRRWSKPGKFPYDNKKILNHVPSSFRMNYRIISPELKSIFEMEGI